MSTMPLPLPLSILCDVTVSVTPQGATTPTFNQGLIIGNSARIPSQGANSRIRLYLSVAQMISDGFLTTDPETIAAGLYFSQQPAPLYLWVGAQDPTAIAAESLDTGHGGTNYAVGDLVAVVQGGASGGVAKVTAVTAGVVTALILVEGAQGTGYVVANGLATTAITGTGAGLEVNVTAIGETPLEAVAACRLAQPAWYLCMVTTAVDADDLAIAAFAQTAVPQMQYIFATTSASAANGATGNIGSLIKAQSYNRVCGIVTSLQGGGAPNNAYMAAMAMGRAMGLNTGLDNSNFTLAGKNLVGGTTDPFTLSQISIFGGIPGVSKGNNLNCYVNYANSYSFFQQGLNGDGSFFDQILGLDMLAADAQIAVLNLYAQLPSIPLDDVGQGLILNAVAGACARSAQRGFLAPGTWTGPTVLKVSAGTSLPTGYQVQSDSFSKQSPSDRALRKGMPVYVTVILADSQQSFTIGINVQQ
jgi:hypothetical protein